MQTVIEKKCGITYNLFSKGMLRLAVEFHEDFSLKETITSLKYYHDQIFYWNHMKITTIADVKDKQIAKN